MTETPKPPMVVWLQNQQSLNEEQWQDDDVTWCRDKIFKHDVGPYVHLDRFIAEVAELLRLVDSVINTPDWARMDEIEELIRRADKLTKEWKL